MSAAKQDEGKQQGFKVSDRRSFAEARDATPGEAVKPEDDAVTQSSAAPPTTSGGQTSPSPEAGDESSRPTRPVGTEENSGALPPVDFHTFILSLGSSALLHLGELDPPDGGAPRLDLRLAKHTIDIIGMLQEKTRGNLNAPEERLMESLLYDLRLRYVERGQRQ